MRPFHSITTQLQLGQTSSLMQFLVTALWFNRFTLPFFSPISHPKPIQAGVRSSQVTFTMFFHIFSYCCSYLFFLKNPKTTITTTKTIPRSGKRNLRFYVENTFSLSLSLYHLGGGDTMGSMVPWTPAISTCLNSDQSESWLHDLGHSD